MTRTRDVHVCVSKQIRIMHACRGHGINDGGGRDQSPKSQRAVNSPQAQMCMAPPLLRGVRVLDARKRSVATAKLAVRKIAKKDVCLIGLVTCVGRDRDGLTGCPRTAYKYFIKDAAARWRPTATSSIGWTGRFFQESLPFPRCVHIRWTRVESSL